MKIIDSHIHFWDPKQLDYPWLGHVPLIAGRHTPDELYRQELIDPAMEMLFVQAECREEQAMQEVTWVSDLAKQFPQIRGIVAYAPMNRREMTRKWLNDLEVYPLVKGIRHHLQLQEDASFCWKPDFIEGMSFLRKKKWVFDICLKHHQLPDAIRLVEQCAENVFVLDHFGNACLNDQSLDQWEKDYKKISEFQNVAVKISGLLVQSPQVLPEAEIKRVFDRTIDFFGSSRMLFGSDWPVVKLNGNYQRWLDLVMKQTETLSEDQRFDLFYRNAQRIYQL